MDQAVIELTQALLSRPSITPEDGGCQQLLSERLSALGFVCEKMRFGEVDNLYARYGTQSPLLVFAGHTDVVPTGPEQDWTSNPFAPEIRDGYLFGRGASDMKSSIAAMVIACEHYLKENPAFPGSIAFLLTSDEEGPATDGTKKVMDVLTARNEKIDFCIVGEPSSDTVVGDQIRVGRRGSLHGKLAIHGKQGHVAHPHLAENPIHNCLAALQELTTTIWDRGNDHFPPTTLQISNIHSGTGASNVIPGHLDCLFNFRFGTASTIKQLQERTNEMLRKYGLAFDIEWKVGAEPFLTQQGKLIFAVQLAITDVTGLNTRLSTGGGTSDGRFIAPLGAELVELGPSHATAHQINESVKIEDLVKLTKIYTQILKLLFVPTEK